MPRRSACTVPTCRSPRGGATSSRSRPGCSRPKNVSATERAAVSRTELTHGWAGAASGPVTVVLHGGGPGCHAVSDFAAVMTLLPERRWLWVDLPGYGGSPSRTDESVSRLAVAARALGELFARLGCGPVDVLAQSLGGTVALHLAAERPELLRRLVVIGSQPTPAPAGRVDVRRDPGLGGR